MGFSGFGTFCFFGPPRFNTRPSCFAWQVLHVVPTHPTMCRLHAMHSLDPSHALQYHFSLPWLQILLPTHTLHRLCRTPCTHSLSPLGAEVNLESTTHPNASLCSCSQHTPHGSRYRTSPCGHVLLGSDWIRVSCV